MTSTSRNDRPRSARCGVVWMLAFFAGACGSGGTNGTGTGGTQGAAGTSGTAGTTGAAGTQGAGGGGTTGTAGTNASAGTNGGAGTNGNAGTTGTGGGGTTGTAGSAGGSTGGAAGGSNGGRGGGSAGAGGAAGGNGGRGGNGGGSGGRGGAAGGAGGTTGTGGGNVDGGSGDAVAVQDGATMTGGAFVRTAWTATYTCTGTCPAQGPADTADADTKRAFDGNRGTRWSTGQYQQSTALMPRFPLYFTVDMKQVVNVSRITLDAGTQDTYDAPGQMDVLLSNDGTNYTTVVSAHRPVSPTNGMTDTIMLPQQTAARYIQLKATMTIKQVNNALADRYWAIGEMNVYP